jgi:hypothetical protein
MLLTVACERRPAQPFLTDDSNAPQSVPRHLVSPVAQKGPPFAGSRNFNSLPTARKSGHFLKLCSVPDG